MVINTKFQAMRFHFLFIFSIFFLACPDPTTDSELSPISNQQFTYHQGVNQLYYGVEVEDRYETQVLSQVKINWYATTRNNQPDTLMLYDDGTNGDILMGDGFYGLKKPSSSEYNHGSDSVILNNSKTSSSVLYQGGCSVWGEIFQIYSRLTTLGKMGLGIVYPPMATLEHPAHASRSGLCRGLHQQPD